MCLSYAVSLPYPKNSLLAHVIPGRMSKATRSYGERGTPWVPWSDLCHDSIQWSSRVATKLSMSHVCMCVWNIWIDVKPLLKQGATGEHCSQRPTKTLQCSCENVPAIFQFFVNGNRLSQEPACRFQTMFKPNLMSGRKRFASSKDVEIQTSRFFSDSLILSSYFPVRFNGVFLHVRCIPHQNSQRLFWASVWFMLDSSRWHEPFGECFSKQNVDATARCLNLHILS